MTRPSHDPPAGGARRSLGERRSRERRALLVGLVVSLVIHVVAIGLVGAWLAPAPPPTRPSAAPLVVSPPRGMRAIELDEVPADAVAEPERPAPVPPTGPPESPEVVVAAEPADSAPADARTAADRLAPRVVDPRLWQPMILIPREPTLADVEARVAAAVELLSDSALAAADAAMRARDWTVEDDSGGKWGISPGKLHLGSVTLPLPIWFPVSEEAVAAEQQWYELDQQLERTRILESFQDRVRAIRERRERERAAARANGNGG